MFIGYQQIAVGGEVKDSTAFTNSFLTAANGGAELQAETDNIRYTMDGTNPTKQTGMLLIAGTAPISFLIEDIRRIKFVQANTAAKLNVHFYSGRNI